MMQDDVTLLIQMPDYPSKPAWGCDGTEFNLEVPLTLLVGTLRDRIAVSLPATSLSSCESEPPSPRT